MQTLKEFMRQTMNQFMVAQQRHNEIVDTVNKMKLVAIECSEMNWDGYGASPVTTEHLDAAIGFLYALPDDIPMPELGADPEGCFSFEWYVSTVNVFSVSVSHEAVLSAAWITSGVSDSCSVKPGDNLGDLIDALRMFIKIGANKDASS